ncbi:hypothetical protein CANTEDRAFT_121354 [Yamadazyma tenuis ATCC 10573]|uniref:WD40 repeat-like protein n=1 Tax=Candida tenuis (strain ATCC 10573 / BCRC 21748 / CBS 615 / JCM 9827 / NBRC 10315 / NRRL Y-1498 / VKM Y-70) TaxID=590646 RepID=G3B3W5_CANTC|nr:uncharacterized protein CANTEDRAFT_121354 [Yamadazyma tenuis ATCC 10573]EGV63749.1 hypothetical protein CANTEDRAFT_121354 [Yamadazyma tenuis ATCC 10573]
MNLGYTPPTPLGYTPQTPLGGTSPVSSPASSAPPISAIPTSFSHAHAPAPPFTTHSSFPSPQGQGFPSQYPPPGLLPPSAGSNLQQPSQTPLSSQNNDSAGLTFPSTDSSISDRYSYYLSTLPLYCSDWGRLPDFSTECIALSSYKEGLSNKLQILHGVAYGKDATTDYNAASFNPGADSGVDTDEAKSIEGFDFYKAAEVSVEYPITNLQWDPAMGSGSHERLAASSEVLRLFKVDHDSLDSNNNFRMSQTHYLTNSTSGATSGGIMNCPPVTSFDWNKLESNLIITASVDTTCTVWDLNRSNPNPDPHQGDSAYVKTQLIAHDSEVFDVKFVTDSTNLFASVGNDGSIRMFDLRSLEHSTIIYEPSSGTGPSRHNYNSKALLKLATSNVDQNYLATIGVNSNQVIVIDTRLPGVPVAVLDGSLGGRNSGAINSIKWHPTGNFLLTGGDDCQALVWDCNNFQLPKDHEHPFVVGSPVLSYEESLEVNNVCWRAPMGDWMGVVSGKGFQAVSI